MILRRITEDLNNQNWTAVFIDFLIVVVGVFVGVQVANWNDARISRTKEFAYVAQLRAEIVFNDQLVAVQSEFVEKVIDGGRQGLDFLDADRPCEQDCELLLAAFFHASQVWGIDFYREKYDELVRLGLPNSETVSEAVNDLYTYMGGWDVINSTPPQFRERVRKHLSPDVAAELWQGCYNIERGAFEFLLDDCIVDLDRDQVAESLERIRADDALAGMLRFWVGQNLSAQRFYPQMRAAAKLAVAEIDADLQALR